MFERRYEIRAVFEDEDFGLVSTQARKFWKRTTANYEWYMAEGKRVRDNVQHWRWVVWDTREDKDITPEIRSFKLLLKPR